MRAEDKRRKAEYRGFVVLCVFCLCALCVCVVIDVSATTWYADNGLGDNGFDGLSQVITNGHGPKRNIANALAAAASGDVVSVAAGYYQESEWTPGTKTLIFPSGPVTLVNYDPGQTDTVGDGIPDWWRIKYFGGSGTTTNNLSCATCDPDGDGINNLQEYQYFTDPTVSNVLDVVVNNGSEWATNRTITLDPSSFPYPFVLASLYPNMSNATVFANTGAVLSYVLPSTNNTTYELFFKYADASTNVLGPLLIKFVTLDTIPPWVEITSPTNGTGDQAFVHLQATVYDPDPQDPTVPGTFRPLKVWINGQQYWNQYGTQIDIPRFVVQPNTNNEITILVQDPAGNESQASVNWYVDTSTATNAPQLFFTTLQTNAVTVLPDMSQIWVSGQMSNLNAIVTATVNGGDPITMNVRSNQFGYLLPLNSGTNTVVVMGSDLAGHTSSNFFTLVRGNSYRFAITSPAPFGWYANGQAQAVSGYVSALKDTNLVLSVTVNGVATTLFTPDGDGNRGFTDEISVNADGTPTVLEVVVTCADGSVSFPIGMLEGFFISSMNTEWDYDEKSSSSPCTTGPAASENNGTQTYSFTGPSGGTTNEIYFARDVLTYTDCSGTATPYPSNGTDEDWVPQPDLSVNALLFGNDGSVSLLSGAGASSSYHLPDTYNGQLTLQFPWYYAPSTRVLLSCFGTYDTTNSTWDMSQVIFQGQSPAQWSDGPLSPRASFLVTVNPGEGYGLSGGSFGWPGYVVNSSYTDSQGTHANTESAHLLAVTRLGVQKLLPEIDIDGITGSPKQNPGGLVVCNCDNNGPPRQKIIIGALSITNDTVVLTIPSQLKVFTDVTNGTQVSTGATFPGAGLPTNLYVEGSTASSALMDAKLSVQIQGASGSSDYVNFTVVWGTVSIQRTGTTPANAVQFGTLYDETENLGGQLYDGGAIGVGKVVPIAQLSPVGINANASIKTGWSFRRERWFHTFQDETQAGFNDPTWTNDTSSSGVQNLTPDTNDKIYDRDAPNVAIFYAISCTEVYANFHQWVEWNGVRASGGNPGNDSFPDAAKWHWRAKWQASATPNIILKDVDVGYITLPSTAAGCP